jgi:hypothetical protein
MEKTSLVTNSGESLTAILMLDSTDRSPLLVLDFCEGLSIFLKDIFISWNRARSSSMPRFPTIPGLGNHHTDTPVSMTLHLHPMPTIQGLLRGTAGYPHTSCKAGRVLYRA